MKIIHIVRQFHPLIGGLEKYVLTLSQRQSARGLDVQVITLNRDLKNGEKLSKTDNIDGIKITRIPYIGSKRYPMAIQALKHIKQADIIHVHAVDFFIDYLVLTKFLFLHRRTIVLHTHGGFFHTDYALFLKKVFFNTITRLTLKGCSKVIACSNSDQSLFTKICNKVIKIENGVDISKYHKSNNTSRNQLLYVGRIDIHKRVDNLILATLDCVDKGHKVHLNIVGPDWGQYIDEYKLRFKSSNFESHVHFHGKLSDQELSNIYDRSSLFLSASEYEGFGISVVEALASGKPVILNDIQAFRDFIKNESYGVIVNFSDTDMASEAIIKFLNMDTYSYNIASEKAYQISKSYSLKAMEEKVYNVYKEFCKKQTPLNP